MTDNILIGDSLIWLRRLPSESVHCIVTSPPYYGLRDYGVKAQIGLEETPEAYIEKLVMIFREARRVLKNNGTLWLNLGDSYWNKQSHNGISGGHGENHKAGQEYAIRAGGQSHSIYKPKDLMMIPARVALALQADGWWLRSDIIWQKPSCMPESVKDRPTKSYEHVFLLSKSKKYFYDQDAIREPHKGAATDKRADGQRHLLKGKTSTGNYATNAVSYHPRGRNKRDVWSINSEGYSGAHFATMPIQLAETCIKAGCPQDGIVLDPFSGSGTTGIAALTLNRNYLLIELSIAYAALAQKRLKNYRHMLDNNNPMKPIIFADGTKQLSLFGEFAS
jgi:DNA modification methylase